MLQRWGQDSVTISYNHYYEIHLGLLTTSEFVLIYIKKRKCLSVCVCVCQTFKINIWVGYSAYKITPISRGVLKKKLNLSEELTNYFQGKDR